MKLIFKLYPDIACSQNHLSIILIDIVVYSVLKNYLIQIGHPHYYHWNMTDVDTIIILN